MVVILGLYFYFIYIPKSEVLTQKTAEMGKLETQVRELRIIAANIKRFQAEAAKLREELQLAIAQLPTSKEIPSPSYRLLRIPLSSFLADKGP